MINLVLKIDRLVRSPVPSRAMNLEDADPGYVLCFKRSTVRSGQRHSRHTDCKARLTRRSLDKPIIIWQRTVAHISSDAIRPQQVCSGIINQCSFTALRQVLPPAIIEDADSDDVNAQDQVQHDDPPFQAFRREKMAKTEAKRAKAEEQSALKKRQRFCDQKQWRQQIKRMQ